MNDAAVELTTCVSATVANDADVERSTRYPPSASSPGAGVQTMAYVEPEVAVPGAKAIDVAPGTAQPRVVKVATGVVTAPPAKHGLFATTRQKYEVEPASAGRLRVRASAARAARSSGGVG